MNKHHRADGCDVFKLDQAQTIKDGLFVYIYKIESFDVPTKS